MIEKLLNSKLFIKLKKIKHIEIYIVIIFIALLLIIYFSSSSNVGKASNNSSSVIIEGSSLNNILKEDESGLVNITTQYEESLKNELKTHINKFVDINLMSIDILFEGSDIYYEINNAKQVDFVDNDISITVNGGVTCIKYEPKIEKIIITLNCEIKPQNKVKITDFLCTYLNITSNKIYFY